MKLAKIHTFTPLRHQAMAPHHPHVGVNDRAQQIVSATYHGARMIQASPLARSHPQSPFLVLEAASNCGAICVSIGIPRPSRKTSSGLAAGPVRCTHTYLTLYFFWLSRLAASGFVTKVAGPVRHRLDAVDGIFLPELHTTQEFGRYPEPEPLFKFPVNNKSSPSHHPKAQCQLLRRVELGTGQHPGQQIQQSSGPTNAHGTHLTSHHPIADLPN
ncbi:hypothetical protein C8R47DRAFT_1068170 [Mycena vitilis]|nr:hypothetical protein C8R47DRAFT_1068170 [Mycena vitilis]